MRRVVFCPSEEFLEEAILLAKNNALQINVGISENIKNLNFNKDLVQVIKIPEIRDLVFEPNVDVFFHQRIDYLSDYVTFNKFTTLTINNNVYKPLIAEKHRVIFSIYETTIGKKNCYITNNDEILEEFEYSVN